MEDDDLKRPDDGKVGYRHPPEHTRFKPGKSGNPRGRPRNDVRPISQRQMRKDMIETMEEEVTIQVNGKSRTVPLIVAVLRKVMIRAASGEPKAASEALGLWRELMREHEDANPGEARHLATIEATVAAMDPKDVTPDVRRVVTNLRRRSRLL